MIVIIFVRFTNTANFCVRGNIADGNPCLAIFCYKRKTACTHTIEFFHSDLAHRLHKAKTWMIPDSFYNKQPFRYLWHCTQSIIAIFTTCYIKSILESLFSPFIPADVSSLGISIYLNTVYFRNTIILTRIFYVL